MGDIWPYGPPRYTSWQQCYDAMLALGFAKADANIMAALGGSEAAYDLAVVNDTPATGDYSVGVWQINYYGALYAERVPEFGTPRHLANSTVSDQAKAARTIWSAQGYNAWGSYTNGNYKAFLNNRLPSGPSPAHQLLTPQDTAISPPTEDYSPTIRSAAGRIDATGTQLYRLARALSGLRR